MKAPLSSHRRQQIEATAAEWIGRQDNGLSAEEQREFEQWRQADPLHAQALARFEATWSALARPRRTGAATALKQELEGVARRQRRRRVGRIGAGAVLCLLAGLLWWSPFVAHSPESTPAIVLLPERQTLPDGSIVEFPVGTEIAIDFTPAARRVVLKQGKAHFQVSKHTDWPFLVDAGRIAVRAVGTAFAVQWDSDTVEVLVTEGRVAVDQQEPRSTSPAARSHPAPLPLAMVDAGNRVVVDIGPRATPAAAPPVIPVQETEIAERLAWRSPLVEFSGAPLASVIASLNQYNGKQFIIEDPKLGAIALSGLFRADDTEAFVRMLETGFGVKVERRDGQIFLRKASETTRRASSRP